jgi:hypothetical protein
LPIRLLTGEAHLSASGPPASCDLLSAGSFFHQHPTE